MVDVTNPNSPTYVKTIRHPQTDLNIPADLQVYNNFLFVVQFLTKAASIYIFATRLDNNFLFRILVALLGYIGAGFRCRQEEGINAAWVTSGFSLLFLLTFLDIDPFAES